MMDISGLDEQLKLAYERNAPPVDEVEFASRLYARSRGRRMRHAPRSRARRMALMALASVIVVAAVAVGVYEAATHLGGETPVVVITDDTMSPTASSLGPHQELLQQALAWIEAAPTEVTFGPYTVDYGNKAKLARLTVAADVKGEPFISGPAWWSQDNDYYVGDPSGTVYHVTPDMALSMTRQTYSAAFAGVQMLGTIRLFGDPRWLLERSTVSGVTKGTDGTWRVEAAATARDLIDLNLPDTMLSGTVVGDVGTAFTTTLVLGAEGSIESMSVSVDGSASETTNYVWTRVSANPTPPTPPSDSVDLDQAMLEQALAGGWRPNLSDAARDFSFPIYSLGETYRGLSPRIIHVEKDPSSLLVEYGFRESTGSGSPSTSPAAGTEIAAGMFELFEYSESDVPQSERDFVAKKTLLKTVTQGDDTYSIYKTSKGKPGQSILVKRGETYISIDRAGVGAVDATDELVMAAAALQLVPPPGSTTGRTLAGLATLKLDVVPRDGVHLQAHMAQVPGSGVVTLIVNVTNASSEAFSFGADDFTLYVDGVALKTRGQVHQENLITVQPGETSGVEGGYFWQLTKPTSLSTGLSYVSSDPGSIGFNRTVRAQ